MNIQPDLLYGDEDEKILEFINFDHRPYTDREKIYQIMKLDDYDFSIRFRLS